LYIDRSSVAIGFQLRDPAGNTQVRLAGLAVVLELTHSNGQLVRTSSLCSVQLPAGGAGECTDTLPASWFSSEATASAIVTLSYDGTEIMRTDAGEVQLAGAPLHPALSSAGMLVSSVRAPLFTNDTFRVTVSAHTGAPAFALMLWRFTMQYDVTVLRLMSWSYSSAYQQPLDSHLESAGTFIALASGLASGVDPSTVTNRSSLTLATFTFKVIMTVSEEIKFGGVIRATADSMINQGTFEYVSAWPAGVSDERNGLQTEGQLTVVPIRAVGVLAYAPTTELTNTAVLDGVEVDTRITALMWFDRPQSGLTSAPASSYSCSQADSFAVFELDGCRVVVASTNTAGKSSVEVLVSLGDLQAVVAVRVWYPLQLVVNAEDAELHRIAGVSASSDCSRPAYQSTRVSAVATFGGAGLPSVAGVDVSRLVSFGAIGSAVVVSGREVTAAAPGEARIILSGSSAFTLAGAAVVRVSNASVSVVSILALVVTGISWNQSLSSSVPWQPVSAQMPASLRLQQQLVVEGATGEVQAVARFTDGQQLQLRASEMLVFSLSSGLTAQLNGAMGPWGVQVAVGATAVCGGFVQVSWQRCNAVVASGYAPIHLQLPDAVSMSLDLGVMRLTSPDDSAAVMPIAVAHSTALLLLVTFSDGSTRDFSKDDRTSYALTSASAGCAAIDGNLIAMLDGAACSEIVVVATVGVFGLVRNASVPIVRLAQLGITMLAFPSYPGATQLSTLRRVGCSNYFQNARVGLRATLSDGSVYTVTDHGSITLVAPANGASSVQLVSRQGVSYIVRPSSAGLVVVRGAFGVQNATSSLLVISAPANVTSVTLSLPSLGSAGELSFGGINGTRAQAVTAMGFDDGSQFPLAAVLDWIPIPALLNFTSSVPSSVVPDALGGFSLRANHYEAIELAARSAVCSGTQSPAPAGLQRVAANLRPALDDVDLGRSSGLQFLQAGGGLSVQVRANAASGRLVAYQVEMHFDAAVLAATQCTGGDMGGFTCTINDPIDRAQLVGVDVSSTLQGSYVLLGTVSLSVRMSAVTLLSGEIVELVRHATGSSTQLSRVSMVPIAAGHGYAAVFGTGGRRMDERLLVPPAALETSRRPRRLAPVCTTDANGCLVGRWGDINSDCDLTAIDVLTAMLINIGVQNLADQCPWAQQQLDPTLDGERAGGTDVRFLQLVVGNKLRFVLNATSSFVGVQEGSRANLVVNVWLLDGQSEPATSRTAVRMEIAYQGVANYTVGSSDGVVAGSGNWLARASHRGGGRYEVAVHPSAGWQARDSVGIAVMVETEDALGGTDDARAFPFLGSAAPRYASSGYAFRALPRLTFAIQ
jgi:hypothetical protein